MTQPTQLAADYWSENLPREFGTLLPPLSEAERFIAATMLTEKCRELTDAGMAEGEAVTQAIERTLAAIRRLRGDTEQAPAESRPPVPSVVQQFSDAVEFRDGFRGGVVELLAPAAGEPGDVVVIRKVKRVLGPPRQPLVLEGTEYQGRRRIDITREIIDELAANAPHFPLVSIDFDHESGKGRTGIAGGLVLTETVTTGTDPETGRYALLGQLAYNLDVADEVRSGGWLGASIRISRAWHKKEERDMGLAMTAWSLTNIPQQHEIEVLADFSNTQLDSPPASGPSAHQEQGSDCPPGDSMSTDLTPIATALELTADAKPEDIAAKVTELTTKLAETDASLTAANERANKAVAEAATLKAAQTDAERTVAELSAKSESLATEFAEFKAGAEAEAAERDVALMVEQLKVAPAERDLALTLRKMGKDSEAWQLFCKGHETEIRQREMTGDAGKDEPLPTGDNALLEFTSKLQAFASEKGIGDISQARVQFKRTETGAALYKAAFDA